MSNSNIFGYIIISKNHVLYVRTKENFYNLIGSASDSSNDIVKVAMIHANFHFCLFNTVNNIFIVCTECSPVNLLELKDIIVDLSPDLQKMVVGKVKIKYVDNNIINIKEAMKLSFQIPIKCIEENIIDSEIYKPFNDELYNNNLIWDNIKFKLYIDARTGFAKTL